MRINDKKTGKFIRAIAIEEIPRIEQMLSENKGDTRNQSVGRIMVMAKVSENVAVNIYRSWLNKTTS